MQIDHLARLARIVVPGLPRHMTQRGNGRAKVFFTPEDYSLYKTLLVEHCRATNVGVWAWCLMPNHVHLVLTPADPDGLRRALAKVHRAYCRHHPGAAEENRTFLARPLRRRRDGRGLPVVGGALCRTESGARRAGETGGRLALVKRSGASDMTGEPDGVTDRQPMRHRLPSSSGLFDLVETDAVAFDALREAETIGRPVGGEALLSRIAAQTGKAVKGKAGPAGQN
ncbi:transposase [Mesorhizobium sp. B2-4-19]|uniref:transposase n=1 Tax=Mesorhizobium sp. B2-4-19 TaxID=2589930 RepID=UPI001FEDC9FD|nr:transposase [Mesorhizobium sp. B2-4-19]